MTSLKKFPYFKPVTLSEDCWYYAMPRCLSVVQRVFGRDGIYIRTELIDIPWSKIKKSLAEVEKRAKEVKKRAKK